MGGVRAQVGDLLLLAGQVIGLQYLGQINQGVEAPSGKGVRMRDPKHPRHFTEDFKRQIVQLYDNGKPAAEIMDEYDLGSSTFHRWVRRVHDTGSTREADNRTPEQARLVELERENKRLRMEVDVLKQAALIFARK